MELSDLPPLDIPNVIRHGRNPYDGYQRGMGIAFYNIGGKIEQDPDFRRARDLAGARTLVNQANLHNIFMLIKFYLPRIEQGHIVEYGSYKGGSSIFMAALAEKFLPRVKVVAFDTFGGMPQTDHAVDYHRSGDFSDVLLPELKEYIASIGLKNLELVQGLFQDTARTALDRIGKVSLCHIDCDIREGIEVAYNETKPHMTAGGYWVFDDPLAASCLGATEAVEDLLISRDNLRSEQICPHYVFRQPFRA